MKIYRNIALFAAGLVAAFACQTKEDVPFVLDSDLLEVEAEGGSATVEVSSPGSWIASANVPWITVSPANGNGSRTCRIIVDSAIVMKNAEVATRTGTVTITGDNWDSRDITVVQQNYGYTIAVEKTEVEVPDYESLSDRYFNVTLNSNVRFAVSFTDGEGNPVAAEDSWIEEYEENPELVLTKGARPRKVTLRFNWDINSLPETRIAEVHFTPVDEAGEPVNPSESLVTRIDHVQVTQTSAAAKPEDPRAADSTALVSISRALNVWSGGWDTSTRMERWDDVHLWEEGDEISDGQPIPDEWVGRVRSVRFFMFNTNDGIPYQVSWLDAAEELEFYSNENSLFREGIQLGEYLMELGEQPDRPSVLKRLTIAAYGLDNESLPDSFFWQNGGPAFPKLEYLNLSSNNFSYIDPRFSAENFPSLHAFVMRSNQRRVVYDLSNSTASSPEQFAEENAGLYLENINPENSSMGGGFPVRLLKWDNLDTLELTLNYLEGSLPTDDQIRNYIGKGNWSHSDKVQFVQDGEDRILSVADSLAAPGAPDADVAYGEFDELQIPKVLPKLRVFSINLNRFSGSLDPDTHKWLMYHPLMDWWEPSTFIFTQEGTDSDGRAARFDDIPVNMDYYYDVYANKKFAD